MARGFDDAFGIYVHFPLCRARCGYCEFSVVVREQFPHEAYARRVADEIAHRAKDYAGLRLDSLYFGGGTPSLWPAREVARVVDAARRAAAGGAEGMEVTLEANPGTVDRALLGDLRAAGVNRLSIGVQSLDDGTLRGLTRRHDARTGRAALEHARAAGFDNVSCDLIFGLGGQSVEAHLRDARELLALGPEHISTYALTLSRGSALRQAGGETVDDDTSAEMMQRGRELLEQAGYEHYEVSNFARPGHRSRHNSLVWSGRPYAGVGAAAHGMVLARHVDGDAGWSQTRIANAPFDRYMEGELRDGPPGHVSTARVFAVDEAQAEQEWVMLGLRLREGVVRERFAARFGRDVLDDETRRRAAEDLHDAGMLVIDDERVAPTPRGIWFADEMALRLGHR
ncbi:MAG: radical SAM family heme chaperone HemW [Myxococcales bacterium]|nr:radical SAM family heme chaperone HemW [Myxococcales bacterium]